MDESQDVPTQENYIPPLWVRALLFFNRHYRTILVVFLAAGLTLFLILLPQRLRLALFHGLLARRTLLGFLITFGLLTFSLLWSAGQRLDSWVFLTINLYSYHAPWLDLSMWAITQIGNGFLGLAAASLLYLFHYRRLAIELILGVLTLWLTVEIIKALTDRTRPYRLLAEARVVGWRERGRSFPSGHTSQAFFMITLVIHYFQLGLGMRFILYGIAFLVGFTRMYVGAHYPRDILAGAILGWVWGTLTVLIDPYLASRFI